MRIVIPLVILAFPCRLFHIVMLPWYLDNRNDFVPTNLFSSIQYSYWSLDILHLQRHISCGGYSAYIILVVDLDVMGSSCGDAWCAWKCVASVSYHDRLREWLVVMKSSRTLLRLFMVMKGLIKVREYVEKLLKRGHLCLDQLILSCSLSFGWLTWVTVMSGRLLPDMNFLWYKSTDTPDYFSF